MPKASEKRQVVILGGGFAGVRSALDLAEGLKGSEYQVLLIDRRDSQVYHPSLYEAATTEHGLVDPRKVKQAVTLPYSAIFRNRGVVFLKAYVEDIDFDRGLVRTDSGEISYAYLLVALGSQPNYYGIPELPEHAFPLKTFEDAIMIRNRLADILNKRESGRIIVGGAGVSGVEFAAELRGLVRHLSAKHGRRPENYQIVMVEGATDFLPNLTEKAAQAVSARLKDRFNIETRFSTLITEAGSGYVTLNNRERLDCDLLVWTGGIRSVRLPAFSALERDKTDRIVVTENLNLKKHPNVFFAGDMTGLRNWETKKPLPQTKTEAISQGRHAAKNILRMIDRGRPLPYSSTQSGYAFQVGGRYAVYHSKDLIMSGWLAWLIKRWKDWLYLRSVMPFSKAAKVWIIGSEIFIKND